MAIAENIYLVKIITFMKVETITYKRVKNLGNYQSETFEATASLDDGDDPRQISQDLKDFVLSQLGLLITEEVTPLPEDF